MLNRFSIGAAVLAAMCLGQAVRANTVDFTTSAGSDSSGALAATVVVTPLNGSIEISVTNSETGTLAKGQAVSYLSFAVSGISTPTYFSELSGKTFSPTANTLWTSTAGTVLDTKVTPPAVDSIEHWGFKASGANVLLATAASPVPGAGSPTGMILPSAGKAGSGYSLANPSFGPYLVGTTNFFLTDAGITTGTVFAKNTFGSFVVGFGTGCDQYLGGSEVVTPTPATAVPLPSVFYTGLAGLTVLAAVSAVRKSRKPAAVTASI